MLYQRRMRLPHVEDPTLNGTPLERMMLSLTSDGVTIGNAEPTVSVQDMPGRDGRLDLTLTDPSGAAYMGDRAITLSLYAIGGEDDILAAKTQLAALAGTIVSLSWRGLPGEYRGRMSLSAWEDKWAGPRQVATLVTVSIDAAPYLIGRSRTVTLKTGANASMSKATGHAGPHGRSPQPAEPRPSPYGTRTATSSLSHPPPRSPGSSPSILRRTRASCASTATS